MQRITFGHVATAALAQTYNRLATEFGGISRSLTLRTRKTEPFHAINLKSYSGNPELGGALLSGHFIYSGQKLDIGRQGDPWSLPAPSERFAFWLHSFNWLPDLVATSEKTATVRARFLVDRWIAVYGDWNPYTWDNDILANRLFSWLSIWSTHLSDDNLSDLAEKRRMNVMRQIKRLRKTFKRTPPGLPKLKAAAVLALGGLYMTSKADGYLDRGLDLLNDEIDIQILPDGGHITRSPEQALQALHILTVLDDALEARGVTGSKILLRAIERIRHVIPFFRGTGGRLSSFNGGSEGNKELITSLIDKNKFKPKPFVYCPQSGYQRVEQGEIVLLTDTGGTPPRPFDTDAHLAPLAFELSTSAGSLIVNCGWNGPQPQAWRQIMRSTAAHSTLVLNNQSAGRLLNHGFKAKVLGKAVVNGSDEVKASRKDQPAGVWLESSHNGYMKDFGLSHRRRLFIKSGGNDIRGEDGLLVPIGASPLSRDEIPFDIRFHLHPKVRATLAQDLHSALLIQPGHVGWRFRTDGGPMRIEESVYLAHGDRPVRAQQIVISGRAFADSDGETKSNRVRWSFRRLEARN